MPGVEEALGFRPKLGVDGRLIRLLRQRVFTTESLIKEFVKNSYEAEAEALHITVHPDGDLEFRDEGKYAGMSPEDVGAFLLIGTPRKAGKRFTDHLKRPIAGEQGIGRLSFTQLYRLVEVETEKDGKRVRFRITEDMIDRAFREPVDMSEHFEVLEPTGVNGTKIVCMGLKEEVQRPDPKQIRQYIATNFLYTLINPRGEFHVFVNGEEVLVRRPKGATISIEERVDGVVIKGDRAEDSAITGCIILLESGFEGECGIQLSVNGSPIGPRRSLGELLGDRSIDEAIPPTKTWGWVEAPFLKYTIGRDNVDTNHISYLKFRDKMLQVAEKIKEAMRRRREEETSRIEASVVKEVCNVLADVLRGEPEFWPTMGTVSLGAVDGTESFMATGRVRSRRSVGGEGQHSASRPLAPHQTSHIHHANQEGLPRKLRGKGSWMIRLEALHDDALLMFTDYSHGIINVNKAHPLYIRRLKSRKQLRSLLTWIVAIELSNMTPDDTSRNRAFARLLNKMEMLMGD